MRNLKSAQFAGAFSCPALGHHFNLWLKTESRRSGRVAVDHDFANLERRYLGLGNAPKSGRGHVKPEHGMVAPMPDGRGGDLDAGFAQSGLLLLQLQGTSALPRPFCSSKGATAR